MILEEVGIDRVSDGTSYPVTFAGMDPIRPTGLKVGCMAAAITGANAVVSAMIWKMRSGTSSGQSIHIDLRKAYVSQSAWQDVLVDYTVINGTRHMMGGEVGGFGNQVLQCQDGRYVMLVSLYASNTNRTMKLLDSGTLRPQLERACLKWKAVELETAAQAAAVPCVMCRTPEEFQATPQYTVHMSTPLIQITKIGHSKVEPFTTNGTRPLSGIRALGMVHVVAGPAVLRQLAAQGADCLNLNTLNWVEYPCLYWQCDAGTRQAYLEARTCPDKVYELVQEADVFVQNLRPNMADTQGFSAKKLAEIRPGIIHVTIGMNALDGPWKDWMGYDFNAAALTGLLMELGKTDGVEFGCESGAPSTPKGVQVVCDFLTGYLATIGIQAALLRRAKEGGSYQVQVNLTQTVMFAMMIGLIEKATLDKHATGDLENMHQHQPRTPKLQSGMTAFGEFTRLGSQIEMSETPEYWEAPIIHPIGSSKAEWLPKK
eukprot:CAMPEP_0170998974 /NCGR_PEP_ID=MMETSP0736-20130129/13796_1 /TAXON_ID=186038 /ORGANISM="Fragilariopsis kerguelensis, Strain L26-C5" /LENGTH=485 /DNA_ID=CAMNT_0011426001 /DNA_START=267 /DNA_END=1724 /DNA_ORIENTATION=+